MSIEIISAKNPSEAWVKASRLIINKGKFLNNLLEVPYLVVEIKDPGEIDPLVDRTFRKMKEKGDWWVDHTIDYLFPRKSQKLFDLPAKGIRKTQTYYSRLAYYRGKVNQLKYIVGCLKRKPHSSQLFCTPFDPETDISPMLKDPRRPYMPKMPCLTGLEFLYRGEGLNLSASFRSHDFGRKAYGNYLSLGMLLASICREVNLPLGKVICFSHSAHIRRKEIGEIRRILSALQNLYGAASGS